MKKYSRLLVLSLIVILNAFSLAKASNPATPWSQVIPSSNGKYVLVLISPKVKEQEEYIFQSREFWRKGGIPAEDVPEAEKALQEEIDKEAAIRKKYPESGLYTAGKSPKFLWRIDLYDISAWVMVSNDGEHVIALRNSISSILEEKPSEHNPDVKEVIKVYPNTDEVILSFYSFGKPIRSYKALELVSAEEKFRSTSFSNFIWSDEWTLDEKNRSFSITKINGEKLVFDMNGNLVSGKLPNQQNSTSKSEVDNVQLPKSENSKSFCGGVALLLGLMLLPLFVR